MLRQVAYGCVRRFKSESTDRARWPTAKEGSVMPQIATERPLRPILIERVPVGIMEIGAPDGKVGLLAALEVDAVWYYDPEMAGLGHPGLRFKPAGSPRLHQPAVEVAFRTWRHSRSERPSLGDLRDPGSIFARYRAAEPISPECLLAETRLEALADDISTESLWKGRPWLLPTWLQGLPAPDPEAAGGEDRLDQYWHVRSAADLFGVDLPGTSGRSRRTTAERGEHLLARMKKWRSMAGVPTDELETFATQLFGIELSARARQKASSATKKRVKDEFGEYGVIARDLTFKRRQGSRPTSGPFSEDWDVELPDAVELLDSFRSVDRTLAEWVRSSRFLRMLDIVSQFQRDAWTFFPTSDGWESFVERRKGPLHRVTRSIKGGPYATVEIAAFLPLKRLEEMLVGTALEAPRVGEIMSDGARNWRSLT
jgi:hypothetical protein